MIVVILGTLAVTISAVVVIVLEAIADRSPIRNWRSSGDQRCDERWGQR
jgi:hypothetical protein